MSDEVFRKKREKPKIVSAVGPPTVTDSTGKRVKYDQDGYLIKESDLNREKPKIKPVHAIEPPKITDIHGKPVKIERAEEEKAEEPAKFRKKPK